MPLSVKGSKEPQPTSNLRTALRVFDCRTRTEPGRCLETSPRPFDAWNPSRQRTRVEGATRGINHAPAIPHEPIYFRPKRGALRPHLPAASIQKSAHVALVHAKRMGTQLPTTLEMVHDRGRPKKQLMQGKTDVAKMWTLFRQTHERTIKPKITCGERQRQACGTSA